MNESTNSYQNPTFLEAESDVINICHPLFSTNKISHFCFLRLFNDASFFCLISNSQLCRHHFSQKYKLLPSLTNNQDKAKLYHFCVPSLSDPYQQAVKDYRTLFNIYYPFFIIEQHDEYLDAFIFATKEQEASVVNYYLNSLALLDKFTSYFKETAGDLIKKYTKNNIIASPDVIPHFFNVNPSRGELVCQTNYETSASDTYPTLTNGIRLTKRQLEIISCIASGRTAKESAKKLNLSHRTIESHLEEIKRKLNVKRKCDVIDLLIESKMIKLPVC